MINVVVFSKDRPAQLELLLRSLCTNLAGWRAAAVSVLYACEDGPVADGYDHVRFLCPDLRWERQWELREFKDYVLSLVDRSRPFTTFLVDDDVVRSPVSLADRPFERFARDPEIAAVSLRLDPGMDYCYSEDVAAPPPAFDEGLVWSWPGAGGDWGYPMSLDGHVFRTYEILPLLERLDYVDPNDLEAALALSPLGGSKLCCYPTSRLVNVPANRVQETAPNRHAGVDLAALNARFLAGERIALAPFADLRPPAPHHEVAYEWEPRTDELAAAAVRPAPPRSEGAHDPEGTPRVSIGMPVFEAGVGLGTALDGLLSQTFGDFELVISDNASSDDTEEICRAYAAEDPRIRYHRQDVNVGAIPNFNNVLELARGEYFMWAAHDDRWEPRYVERMVGLLDRDPGAVLAHAGFDNVTVDGRQTKVFSDVHRLGREEDPTERALGVLRFPEELGKANLVYGLLRTELLRELGGFRVHTPEGWGSDYHLVFELAWLGRFASVEEILFHKTLSDRDDSAPEVELASYAAVYPALVQRLGAPPAARIRVDAAARQVASRLTGRPLASVAVSFGASW